MANWKKIIVSGSTADLTEITASVGIQGTLDTPAQTNVTSLGTLTALQVDNININGNAITSTNTDGNITLTPNGAGDISLGADTITIGDSATDVVLTSNGAGDLTISTNAGSNSGIIKIFDGADGNIAITPNGTGEVDISKF